MPVPGFVKLLVHGIACLIEHNTCISKRTEQFYTIIVVLLSCLPIDEIVSWLSVYVQYCIFAEAFMNPYQAGAPNRGGGGVGGVSTPP